MTTPGKKKSFGPRVGFLVFCGILLLAGFAMTGNLVPNAFFGVRTAETLSDATTWTAVNSSTGLMLAFWGWAGLTLVSLRCIGLPGLLVFLTSTVALVAWPAVTPSTFIGLHALLTAHGFKPSVSLPLIGLLSALVLFVAAGNVLSMENVARNRHFGFRLKALLESDDAWQKGNHAGGRILHLVAGGGLLLTLGLYALGFQGHAFVVALATILLSPLLAMLGVRSAIRP